MAGTPGWITYANQGATRNQPLDQRMYDALSFLGDMGITAQVFSGGQPGIGTSSKRVGSTRHDHGLAGDMFFIKDGRRLDWSNPADVPIFQEIVRRGKERGLTGFGAGPGYMQPGSMHVGFGDPAFWGAGNSSANAPAWLREAYGAAPAGGGTGGGGRIASSSGGTPAMGLMDFQQSPEPQTFKERLQEGIKSGALWDNLALAFNSMRLNPDQGIGQIVQSRQEQRAQERTANRTAQWLMSQGREDLARALLSGAVDAKTAAAVALTPPADNRTAMIQNYEYWLSQGRSPEEAQALAKAGAGGPVINQNFPDESQGALNKKLAESEAATLGAYLTQGNKAASMTQDLALLDEVLKYAPQNPLAGRVAEMFPGVSSAGAAAQSIIKRVAPSLRVEGSGSTSDIEYAGMLQSLPSLVNYPEANAAILGMMKAKAAIDLERGQIVRSFQNSNQTPADAAAMRQRLSELDQRSIMTPELRGVLSGLSGASTPAPTPRRMRFDENGNLIND